MKISCCWLYAITKYSYPPSLENTFRVLGEMKALGFEFVELEGVRRENLLAVYEKRNELKKFCDDQGLRVINFCPVLPQSVSLNRKERDASWDLFKRGIEIAEFFDCATIQADSFTPPLRFRGDSPYKASVTENISAWKWIRHFNGSSNGTRWWRVSAFLPRKRRRQGCASAWSREWVSS